MNGHSQCDTMTMFPSLQINEAVGTAASNATMSGGQGSRRSSLNSGHRCMLPNSKYCLLDLSMDQHITLSRLKTAARYDWVPMSVCTMYTAW